MKVEDIKKIGVVGAGLMGSQIAQHFAQFGYEVGLMDVKEEFLTRGIGNMKSNLEKFFVKKGKLTPAQAEDVIRRIKGTTNLAEAVKDADFIVEAIPENIELKKQVFKQLDEICLEHAILASNTSSLSITEIALATKRPSKVIGTHFFNPVAVMKLVEVVRGLSSDETVELTCALISKIDKTPIVCRDSPGFLANRVYAPLILEALWCVYTGVAGPKEIDTALKLGYNLPMGPFELGDLTGWDTILSIAEYFYREFGNEKYAPCPLLRMIVRAGYLGRKVGKSFYEYYEKYLKGK